MDAYQNFGAKEMYDINLRTVTPVEILGRKYEINESLINFKTAEICDIQQTSTDKAATGGYGNEPLVWWETDKQTTFRLQNGVLSPIGSALLSNSKLIKSSSKSLSYFEELQVIENNNTRYIDLKYIPNFPSRLGAQPNPNNEPLPMGRRPELDLKPLPISKTKWIFCYNADGGDRIKEFIVDGNRLYFKDDYRKVRVDYTFDFEDSIQTLEIGNRLCNGFLKLDGKINIKNEKTGEVTTALIEMPKIKLSTNLTINLGKDYTYSTVSNFNFVGFPDETRRREDRTISYITYLGYDISGNYID